MEKFEGALFYAAFAAYAFSMAGYLLYAFTKKERLGRAAYALIIAGALLHLGDFAVRAYVGRVAHGLAHYVPWSNWFESFSLFAFIIAVTFILVQKIYELHILGAFVVPLQWILLVISLTHPDARSIPRLAPALQSIWMAIHVPVMFAAYSAFAVAFAVGIVYLLQERELKSRHPGGISESLPALEPLDILMYRLILWGFPLLSAGIVLGALWANDAWGRYWGWDAKETWALITWVIYALYLHMRLIMSWRGRKTVLLSIFAFGVVLFTYVGVNYLSQHHGFLTGRSS